MSLLRRIESARPAADVTGAAMPPCLRANGGGGMAAGSGHGPTRAYRRQQSAAGRPAPAAPQRRWHVHGRMLAQVPAARVVPRCQVPHPAARHRRPGPQARPVQPGRGAARDRGGIQPRARRRGARPHPRRANAGCSSRSPTRSSASARSSRSCATRASPKSWSTARARSTSSARASSS